MSHPRTPLNKRTRPTTTGTPGGLEYSPLTPAQQQQLPAGSTSKGPATSPSYEPSFIPETPEPEPDPFYDQTLLPEDSDSSDDEDMSSDLLFNGNPGDLDNILTHCQVVFLSKPTKFADEATKCGYLAAKFRGPALNWLSTKLADKATKDTLLTSWKQFEALVRKEFQASEETRRHAAEQQLRNLRQKGSAQKYALQFETLQNVLKYDDAAKSAAFMVGLKPEVKKQLVGITNKNYADLRATAIDYDEQLFSLRNPSGRAKSKGSKTPHKSAT